MWISLESFLTSLLSEHMIHHILNTLFSMMKNTYKQTAWFMTPKRGEPYHYCLKRYNLKMYQQANCLKFDVENDMQILKGLALQFDKDYCGWWRLWHDFYWFTTKNGILRISKPKTTSQACFQILFSDWTVNQSNKNPIENSIKFLENNF